MTSVVDAGLNVHRCRSIQTTNQQPSRKCSSRKVGRYTSGQTGRQQPKCPLIVAAYRKTCDGAMYSLEKNVWLLDSLRHSTCSSHDNSQAGVARSVEATKGYYMQSVPLHIMVKTSKSGVEQQHLNKCTSYNTEGSTIFSFNHQVRHTSITIYMHVTCVTDNLACSRNHCTQLR